MSTSRKVLSFVIIAAVIFTNARIYTDSVTNSDGLFKLYKDDFIQHLSPNGVRTMLKMQRDGNLVLRYNDSVALWAAGTQPRGNYTQLNIDGNLEVINVARGQNESLWESGTTGHDNGYPHTLVVADKCAYIMDRDQNIFWTSSRDSNCTAFQLDLEIQKSNEQRPNSTSFLSPLYGDATKSHNTKFVNEGRVNAINIWGIATSDSFNNTLFIKDWHADNNKVYADNETPFYKAFGSAPSDVEPAACDPFVLNDNDYITGYNIYDSVEFIHGITFYTSLGCKYKCFGKADTGQIGSYSVANHGIVSYYYGVNDFWYLSGFRGYAGWVTDSLQLHFTQLPPDTNLSTSDKLMCEMTSSPTPVPTNEPTIEPTATPTTEPTSDPTADSTIHTTFTPLSPPTLHPSVASLSTTLTTRITTTNPSYPTTNSQIVSLHPVTPSPLLQEQEIREVMISTTEFVPSQPTESRASTRKSVIHTVLIWVSVCVVSVCVLVLIVRCLYKKARRDTIRKQTTEIVKSMEMTKLSMVECNESHIPSDNKPHSDILRWLKDVVKLEQYYDCFVENGYDEMEFIKDIVDKEDLKIIGIELPGHQTRIYTQIMALRSHGRSKVHSDDVMVAEGESSHTDEPIVPLIMGSDSEESDLGNEETDGFTLGQISLNEDQDVDLIQVNQDSVSNTNTTLQ